MRILFALSLSKHLEWCVGGCGHFHVNLSCRPAPWDDSQLLWRTLWAPGSIDLFVEEIEL